MRVTTLIAALLLPLAAAAARADQPPLYKTHGDWTGRCMSDGLCIISSGPFDLVRSWERDAKPAFCYYGPRPDADRLMVTIDGKGSLTTAPAAGRLTPEAIKTGHGAFAAYLRSQMANGRGVCTPTEPWPQLLATMGSGHTAVLEQGGKSAPLPLDGFTALAEWMDDRQGRAGTAGALLNPGSAAAGDAPHGAAVLRSDTLPDPVRAVFADPKRQCQTIRKETFDGAGAARVDLGGAELFLLPCGAPGTNQPFLAVTLANGRATTQPLAFLSGGKLLSDESGMNLVWDGRNQRLVGRQTMGYACSVEVHWRYAGTQFLLDKQMQKVGCGKPDAANAQDWAPLWPPPAQAAAASAPGTAASGSTLRLGDEGLGPFTATSTYAKADASSLAGSFSIERMPKAEGEAGLSSIYALKPHAGSGVGSIDVTYVYDGGLDTIAVSDPGVANVHGHKVGDGLPGIVPADQLKARCAPGLERMSGRVICQYAGAKHLAVAFSLGGWAGPDGAMPPADVLAKATVEQLLWLARPSEWMDRQKG